MVTTQANKIQASAIFHAWTYSMLLNVSSPALCEQIAPNMMDKVFLFGNGFWLVMEWCVFTSSSWQTNPSSHTPLWTGGHFKSIYELLNLRALQFSPVNKIHIFQCTGEIFVAEFKGTLWNSTQNILPIHWKIRFLYSIEILRALMFKSSYTFLKCPPDMKK